MREGVSGVADAFAVLIAKELLNVLPGRVSIEADARLAYDTDATIDHALRIIELAESQGLSRDRILIKIASTFEGVQAIEALQKQGVNCNATLVFSLMQAHAVADAAVTLISPFVGRIRDWYAAHPSEPQTHGDAGVKACSRIYDYITTHFADSVVMAASFRGTDQIRALAGIQEMTLSPQYVHELSASSAPLERQLSTETAKAHRPEVRHCRRQAKAAMTSPPHCIGPRAAEAGQSGRLEQTARRRHGARQAGGRRPHLCGGCGKAGGVARQAGVELSQRVEPLLGISYQPCALVVRVRGL